MQLRTITEELSSSDISSWVIDGCLSRDTESKCCLSCIGCLVSRVCCKSNSSNTSDGRIVSVGRSLWDESRIKVSCCSSKTYRVCSSDSNNTSRDSRDCQSITEVYSSSNTDGRSTVFNLNTTTYSSNTSQTRTITNESRGSNNTRGVDTSNSADTARTIVCRSAVTNKGYIGSGRSYKQCLTCRYTNMVYLKILQWLQTQTEYNKVRLFYCTNTTRRNTNRDGNRNITVLIGSMNRSKTILCRI